MGHAWTILYGDRALSRLHEPPLLAVPIKPKEIQGITSETGLAAGVAEKLPV